jgi:D-aspartate ligase
MSVPATQAAALLRTAVMSEPTVFVITHEPDPRRKKKSTSIIGLTLSRSLGRRGFRVVRLHPNLLDHSLASRYVSEVRTCPDFYESEAALVEFLVQLAPGYGEPRVLLPASDDCAYFLAKYRRELEAHYRVVGPTWDVMEHLYNKRRQYEFAQALGIPIPETYFPASIGDVEALAPNLRTFPYVIKPLVAHQWRRASMKGTSKGKKAFRVDTPEDLVARYREIAAGDPNVMIQEVIGGRDERLFTFLGCFGADHKPVAYCIRKKVRQSPIDFGYCTMTVSCEDERVEAQSIQLLGGIGYQGLCGVEWKLDPRTSTYKLIEINARAVNTTGIGAACGVDLPYLAVADALAPGSVRAPRWESNVGWINMAQDIWAARDLNRAGRLSFADWLDSLRIRKVHAVYARDDLRPFLGYFGDFCRLQVQRALGKISRKSA